MKNIIALGNGSNMDPFPLSGNLSNGGRRFFLPFAASSYHKELGAVYYISFGGGERKAQTKGESPAKKDFLTENA